MYPGICRSSRSGPGLRAADALGRRLPGLHVRGAVHGAGHGATAAALATDGGPFR